MERVLSLEYSHLYFEEIKSFLLIAINQSPSECGKRPNFS